VTHTYFPSKQIAKERSQGDGICTKNNLQFKKENMKKLKERLSHPA
jgi:hypothetical protein